MEWDSLLRFVFILYCAVVGTVLAMAPWMPGWDHMVGLFPHAAFRWLQTPAVRGALTGFGLVHLVWGAHDLSEFWRASPRTDGRPTS